ncbi:MAG: DNA polymerase-3 subunit epsilon [Psychromonas sp.]|jgi:DNA polymerase-3 subunit epsilon|uniref:exonuclease domain-containing protein n=1 Tax=Psychromonas sp. TaxID=1884585 RepID=UPI0039E4F970
MLRLFKKRDPLARLQEKRTEYLTHNPPELLKEHLWAALPAKSTPVEALSFLVVDFETTGFEAESNDIISIGWIEISGMQIDVASKQHLYIRNDKLINHETAVINHIVPKMLSQGITLDEAIASLLRCSTGKILVVHSQVIEKSFVDFYMQNSLGIPAAPLLWIDTLIIEKWRAMQKEMHVGQDHRLSSARKRYNLPNYAAHNALIDALSTAELLLAQIAHIYRRRKATFEELYSISQ